MSEIPIADRLQVEFHCHSVYSKDSLTSLEALLAECRKKGIQRLAITDHNRTAGAILARQMDPELVIVGEEIMTTRGELLAFFVEEEIPRGLEPEEAIRRLREQGAFISVSHPFDHARSGAWALDDLEAITTHVDAIETFNARCLSDQPNHMAVVYANAHRLPGTCGSDAHILSEVGTARQELPPFQTADELKQVIQKSRQIQRLSPFWVHFASTYARYRKRTGTWP